MSFMDDKEWEAPPPPREIRFELKEEKPEEPPLWFKIPLIIIVSLILLIIIGGLARVAMWVWPW